MRPFSLTSVRAMAVLGAGTLLVGAFGALGASPIPVSAAAVQPAAAAPLAGPPPWGGGARHNGGPYGGQYGAAGFAGRLGFGFGAGGALAASQEAVTKLLGLSMDQIHTQRLAGKSLAAIAQAQDVSPDKLVQAIMTVRQQRVNAMVQSGALTKDQGDKVLQQLTDRVREMIWLSGAPRWATS